MKPDRPVRKIFLRLAVASILPAILILGIHLWTGANRYRVDGELVLPPAEKGSGPAKEVEVVRDEKGMAYVRASSLEDLLFAQGFVTAQDRLFNLHLVRLLTQGRLTELAGESARGLDVRHRTLGFHRLAVGHGRALDGESRRLMQRYADGINAFLACCPDDRHLEFRLAGLDPEPWTVEDSLAILYYMAWSSAANLKHEITYLALSDAVGEERARTLDPININPDDPPPSAPAEPDTGPHTASPPGTALPDTASLPGAASLPKETPGDDRIFGDRTYQVGSNNWASKPSISAGGRAMLAGDPHLDPRALPGVWYPMGLIWPGGRAVGATIPGLPAMSLGRTEHVALAMTNAYGDAQDLFIETVDPADPDRYLEDGESHAFDILRETLRIKGDDGFREETFEIRFTRRGPVVSGRLPGLGEERTVSLRWAAADPETWTPRIGFLSLLQARTVADVDRSLDELPMIGLNFVMADASGNIGWRVSGRLPTRIPGAGRRPARVGPGGDTWTGWIPLAEMPRNLRVEGPWIGTANHLAVPRSYPYYYTDAAASSFRYTRLKELFSAAEQVTVDDFWRWQRDVVNPMARKVSPILAAALAADERTRELGEILAAWDHRDEPDLAAPLVFQEVYRQLALATYGDELGPEATRELLGNLYYWQERLQKMVVDGGPTAESWWDDRGTPARETLEDLIVRAGITALGRLGDDPSTRRWGPAHFLRLYHPLRRQGLGSDWIGTGPLPMGGSPETLYRGGYDFHSPYAATFTASLRMVVDFADDHKVRAVLPGGVAGRALHPHYKDQVQAFMNGEPVWWWFSEKAIEDHAVHRLSLRPSTDDRP